MATVEHEDNLLNARTGIFLAVNSLLISAIGDDGFSVPHIVELLGLLITSLWAWVVWQNRKAIIRAHGRKTGKLTYPTDILAIWLPSIVWFFWLALLVISFGWHC